MLLDPVLEIRSSRLVVLSVWICFNSCCCLFYRLIGSSARAPRYRDASTSRYRGDQGGFELIPHNLGHGRVKPCPRFSAASFEADAEGAKSPRAPHSVTWSPSTAAGTTTNANAVVSTASFHLPQVSAHARSKAETSWPNVEDQVRHFLKEGAAMQTSHLEARWSPAATKTPYEIGEDMLREQEAMDERTRFMRNVNNVDMSDVL